jgi:hypothetical protein
MPFSIVNRGQGWFWCSLLEMRPDALIGPFPSQEEAEKDARATLGIQSDPTVPAYPLSSWNYLRHIAG